MLPDHHYPTILIIHHCATNSDPNGATTGEIQIYKSSSVGTSGLWCLCHLSLTDMVTCWENPVHLACLATTCYWQDLQSRSCFNPWENDKNYTCTTPCKTVPWQCCRNPQSIAPGRNGSCFLQQQLVTQLAKHRSSTAAGAGAFGGASGATTGLGSRLLSRSGTWCQTHLEKDSWSASPICQVTQFVHITQLLKIHNVVTLQNTLWISQLWVVWTSS